MNENESERLNMNFIKEILENQGGETIKTCFQCGSCTSGCPIARFNDLYLPRKLMLMAKRGRKSKILQNKSLWLCASCFNCTDCCPQGVKVSEVLRIIRNYAVKEGFIPDNYRELANNIIKTGYSFKISDLQIGKRKTLGLPPLPIIKTKDLGKLAELTKISKILEKKEIDH